MNLKSNDLVYYQSKNGKLFQGITKGITDVIKSKSGRHIFRRLKRCINGCEETREEREEERERKRDRG